jgi:RNA polymerase sigma-70 factor (sigma-E family)
VCPLDHDVTVALDAYVRVRGHRLVRTAYLLCGNAELAEDLVQNALASVLASWRRLPEVTDLDAYVYTALVNASRRWWRRRWHGEIPSEQVPDVAVADDTARFDRHEDLVAVLGTLPTRQRQALVLRYFEDLSEAQTAKALGCSVGTVKSQTSRGLDKMRAALGTEREAYDIGAVAVSNPQEVPATRRRRTT